MSNPVNPLFDRSNLRQVKQVQTATAPQFVPIAPAARSFAAILMAVGVPDEDLDGVKDLMMDLENRGELGTPTSFTEIAQQVRMVKARYDQGERLQLRVGPQVIDGN